MSLFTLNHGLLSAVNKGSGGLPSFSIKVLAVNSDESRWWFSHNTKFDSCDIVAQTDDTITYVIKRNDTDWNKLFLLNDDNDENPYLLEVLDANTSGVTNMRGMFYFCTSLTSVALFDTSLVTNMSAMFCNCTSLTSVPLFNTSNVENMSNMLDTCESITSIPLFDTSSVTNMNGMLHKAKNVESGALALYQQASARADEISHTDTFSWCGTNTESGLAELEQIPTNWGGNGLSAFTIKVLAVNSDESREWFENNEKFDSCDVVSQTDDTITYLIKRDDTDWSMMFVLNDDYDENPYLLEVLQANTSGVINMESMCDTCTSLTSVHLFDTSSVEYMDYILYDCVNVESGALALYQQASARADEISHSEAFYNCGADTESGIAELQQIPHSWGGLSPFSIKVLAVNSEDSRSFFENNEFYDSCDVVAQTADTITYVIKSSRTNWDSFFAVFDDNNQYAENPYLLQVLESDTSGVENMQHMFIKCINLTSVQLDTSSVENMSHMLQDCIGLNAIPSLDITNAIFVQYMFFRCVNVESGALEFYNRASSSGNVEYYSSTFFECGINTESGRAELAQIPDDWK